MKKKGKNADTAQICTVGTQELIINQVSREDYFLMIPDDSILLILNADQDLALQDRSIDLEYSCAIAQATCGVIYLKLGDEVVIRAYNAIYCVSRYLNGWLNQERIIYDPHGCCSESGHGKWFYCATQDVWTRHYPTNDVCPVCHEIINMRDGDKHGSRVMEGEYSQSPVESGC